MGRNVSVSAAPLHSEPAAWGGGKIHPRHMIIVNVNNDTMLPKRALDQNDSEIAIVPDPFAAVENISRHMVGHSICYKGPAHGKDAT